MKQTCTTCKGGRKQPGCNHQACEDCGGTGKQQTDPEYDRGYAAGQEDARAGFDEREPGEGRDDT